MDRRHLKELEFHINAPIPCFEDNQSAIKIMEEQRDQSKLKHIDVKHNFVKELVLN